MKIYSKRFSKYAIHDRPKEYGIFKMLNCIFFVFRLPGSDARRYLGSILKQTDLI